MMNKKVTGMEREIWNKFKEKQKYLDGGFITCGIDSPDYADNIIIQVFKGSELLNFESLLEWGLWLSRVIKECSGKNVEVHKVEVLKVASFNAVIMDYSGLALGVTQSSCFINMGTINVNVVLCVKKERFELRKKEFLYMLNTVKKLE